MGSDEMGSYYRDPDLAFHIDDRFNHNHIPLSNPNGRHVGDQGDNERSQEAGPTRYCSVRGCTSVLPPNYGNKMCEVCRGRHRVYASTKRAKRKMEKAALGLQNGWIPTEDDPHPSEPSSSSPANLIPIQEVGPICSCITCCNSRIRIRPPNPHTPNMLIPMDLGRIAPWTLDCSSRVQALNLLGL